MTISNRLSFGLNFVIGPYFACVFEMLISQENHVIYCTHMLQFVSKFESKSAIFKSL